MTTKAYIVFPDGYEDIVAGKEYIIQPTKVIFYEEPIGTLSANNWKSGRYFLATYSKDEEYQAEVSIRIERQLSLEDMFNAQLERQQELAESGGNGHSAVVCNRTRQVVVNKENGAVAEPSVRVNSAVASIGDGSTSLNYGYNGVAVNTGYHSMSAVQGKRSAAIVVNGSSLAQSCSEGSVAVATSNVSSAVTSGIYSVAVTTNNSSLSYACEDMSLATANGIKGRAMTGGNNSVAIAHGSLSRAKANGDKSTAVASGYRSVASANGKNSIAVATGNYASAAGELGNWIVLAEYDTDGTILQVRAFKVDGKRIKPNTRYTLCDGEPMEDGEFVID